MAKAKKFDISNFMDDAAESVHVAEQQKKKEAHEREQQIATPVQNTQPNPETSQPKVAEPQPTFNDNRVGESQIPVQQEEPAKGKRGRKKSLRTIERVNGKIIFLEKGMDVDLARLSTFERFDKQDIIRTALYQWLQVHFDGMMLDNDGRREVIEYIQRTTTFEEG